MIPFPINEETSDKFPANDGAVTQSEKVSEKTGLGGGGAAVLGNGQWAIGDRRWI